MYCSGFQPTSQTESQHAIRIFHQLVCFVFEIWFQSINFGIFKFTFSIYAYSNLLSVYFKK